MGMSRFFFAKNRPVGRETRTNEQPSSPKHTGRSTARSTHCHDRHIQSSNDPSREEHIFRKGWVSEWFNIVKHAGICRAE